MRDLGMKPYYCALKGEIFLKNLIKEDLLGDLKIWVTYSWSVGGFDSKEKKFKVTWPETVFELRQ